MQLCEECAQKARKQKGTHPRQPGGRGRPWGPDARTRWLNVDWSQKVRKIASDLGVTVQAVYQQKRRVFN